MGDTAKLSRSLFILPQIVVESDDGDDESQKFLFVNVFGLY